jgi:hypothetical protein
VQRALNSSVRESGVINQAESVSVSTTKLHNGCLFYFIAVASEEERHAYAETFDKIFDSIQSKGCAKARPQMKTTDCEFGMSKRLRQRRFLHISISSTRTM